MVRIRFRKMDDWMRLSVEGALMPWHMPCIIGLRKGVWGSGPLEDVWSERRHLTAGVVGQKAGQKPGR
jgi:hypothetical protein